MLNIPNVFLAEVNAQVLMPEMLGILQCNSRTSLRRSFLTPASLPRLLIRLLV